MNGPVRTRRGRFFLMLAPLVLFSAVVPAGRSDAAGTVTAAEVVSGLKKIEAAASEVAEYAGTDKAKAQKHAEEIEPAWSGIEDTVKANHKGAYASFEEAIDVVLAAAKAGDAGKADGGAGSFSSTVKLYAASFPAGFGAPAADPKAAPAPTPAAADDTKAGSERKAAATAEDKKPAPDATLARTGPHDAAVATAGAAFGLGGLALIGGARRRRSSRV